MNEARTDPLEALAGLLRRGTPRRFDPARPVDDGLLRRVLAVASLTPSEFDLQPARFVVVREPAERRALRPIAFGNPLPGDAAAVVVVLGYLHPHRTDLDAIVAAARGEGAMTAAREAELRGRVATALGHRGEAELAARAGRAGSMAAAALLLAARAAGLAAAYVDNLDRPALRSRLGIPADHAVCGIVAIGHAAAIEPFAGRLPLAEVCFDGHFGRPWNDAASRAGVPDGSAPSAGLR
ncbi:NADH dehydrogenase [Aquisphaera giovannonii]|uniref:NADH dehydrogenase n=1 Tax=Aquisphaera giovannonii TaxID=406548 RepID=A0A5B9W183_9BACT|nr:nitroreductase family protein [Aquisphaera giovannonii]QEH34017.1 NADH dehydrogenase [Aquisphaera giovannonii]